MPDIWWQASWGIGFSPFSLIVADQLAEISWFSFGKEWKIPLPIVMNTFKFACQLWAMKPPPKNLSFASIVFLYIFVYGSGWVRALFTFCSEKDNLTCDFHRSMLQLEVPNLRMNSSFYFLFPVINQADEGSKTKTVWSSLLRQYMDLLLINRFRPSWTYG